MVDPELVQQQIAEQDAWLESHRTNFLALHNGPALLDAVKKKIQVIDERTARISSSQHGYGYPADGLHIRLAARYTPLALEAKLGHLTFRCDLTDIEGFDPKPQMLFEFEDSSSNRLKVLKVYGRERHNEAALQRELSAANIAVVAPDDFSMGPEGGWMLMDRLAGSSLEFEWQRNSPSVDELNQATRKVATIANAIHQYCYVNGLPVRSHSPVGGARQHVGSPTMNVSRTVVEGVGIHVRVAIERLIAADFSVDPDLWEFFEKTCSDYPPLLLHGDISPGNAIRVGNEVSLIDASGYWGARSFDAASWIIRVGALKDAYSSVAKSWIDIEVDLDAGELLSFISIEAWRHAGILAMFADGYTIPDETTRSINQLTELARRCRGAASSDVRLTEVPSVVESVASNS